MKSATPHTKTSAKPAPTPLTTDEEERKAFFEKCYLALLSSALAQFEVYNDDGEKVGLYLHDESEGEDAEETTRIEVLTDRCFRFARAATNRYFEERELPADFASRCV